MSREREPYTMGYGPAATTIMASRTTQSHAAFFLPYLKPGMSLLDCGCGPGSLTLGFAELLAPGQVVGTEIEGSHVALASQAAIERDLSNVRFEVADIYALPFEDASFDAVFISAVLGNLREPVRGLREAYRVLKPGGIIGIKEFDHGGDLVYPLDPVVMKYDELYRRLREENGHDPEGGRKIGKILLDAGFHDLKRSASYESYGDPMSLRDSAEVSIGLLTEGWADAFMSRGWVTAEEINEMYDGLRKFPTLAGAFYAYAWCEAVARR
jgi:SAM-dependent methyltransferase